MWTKIDTAINNGGARGGGGSDDDDYDNQYDGGGSNHLFVPIKYFTFSLLYIISLLVTYMAFVHLCLLIRSLRISFGKRSCPNGSKAVIITGATSGFGLATAKRLYKLGFTVFACYYNDQEPGYAELLELKLRPFDSKQQKTISRKNYQRPELFLVRMDVRSLESIECSGKEISQLLDVHNITLHALINNAGTSRDGPFELSSQESIMDMIQTNLTGTMMVTKQFVLTIIQNKARVVNVSSGVRAYPGRVLSLYGSTKCAVAYFSDALNEDLKMYGASCCTLIPGNFFASSNLVYTKVRYLQESIEGLSDVERVTYKSTIDEFSLCMNRLLKMKLDASSESRAKIASTYRIKIPNFDQMPAIKRRKVGLLTRVYLWFINKVDGSPSELNKPLEDTGVIDAFEDAVRLKRPPRHLYAGNWFYYRVSGPITEYIPQIMTTFMGNLLVEGLGRS